MPVRIRRARASVNGGASNGDVRPDNRLALADQAFFAGQSALGQEDVVQAVWLYEHPIDLDGLRRFHHNLGSGLLGRRIERSPVGFARYRWVSDPGPSDIDVAECARPRAELSDWIDERAQLTVDAERGPGWHLGVQPFTDGSTAVSLVASHYLVDGLGFGLTIAEALLGMTRDFGYPPPLSRTRARAVAQDLRQTARDVPEVARALGAAVKMARSRPKDTAQSPAPRPAARRGDTGDDVVVVPFIEAFVDLDAWDARAEALGGTRNALVSAFAVKFAERMGRRRASDGAVTLQIPISDRTEGDTRASAVSFARASVDPAGVTTDLHDLRAAINQGLETLRTQQETQGESLQQILWLTPFAPKWALKRLADGMIADPDLPVFCSNLGDFSSLVCRIDGTEAEYVTARMTRQRVTRQWLERTGGLMAVLSGRIQGKLGVGVLCYQPGAVNTKPALCELAAHTLAEFGLTGEMN